MITKAVVSLHKCQKILWSCRTSGQLKVALNYITMATNAEKSNLSRSPFKRKQLQKHAERLSDLMEMRNVCLKHINLFNKGNY